MRISKGGKELSRPERAARRTERATGELTFESSQQGWRCAPAASVSRGRVLERHPLTSRGGPSGARARAGPEGPGARGSSVAPPGRAVRARRKPRLEAGRGARVGVWD